MVIKRNGDVIKSPSSFKININDEDLDTHRSPVTADLIDKTLAKGLVGFTASWDYLTEEESEIIMAHTWHNPMHLTIKCPILGGKLLEADFRCAKRSCEMIQTDKEEESSKTCWKVSFTASQKTPVEGQ